MQASEEDGSLSLSHKGLENTTYERKGPDIRRAFFIKQREDIIDERLNNVGLQQLRLTDDGNCLFQSLSYQLYGFSYKHEEIRMKICALMGDSKETLLQYFDSMEQLEKYIDEMSKDARWGDELALHYAAEKFQVEIHVLTCEDKNFYRHYKPAFNKETKDVSHRHIFLSYVPPMHFQPICTEKSMRRLKSIVDVS